jgi:hypothetical protein
MNKRLQLLIVALSTAGLVTAQSNQKNTVDPTHAVKVTPKPATYGHAKYSSGNPVTVPSSSRSSRNASIGNSIGSTTVIGETQYDLQ